MPDVSTRTVSTRDASTRTVAGTNTGATSTRTVSTSLIPSSRALSSEGRSISTIPAGTAPSQSDLEAINQRILTNAGNYLNLAKAIGPPYYTQANDSGQALNGGSTVDTNNPLTNAPIYGTGNPFDILGDAFTRAFGGSTYNPQPQQPSTIVQPVGTSSGGSSIAIILILGAVGVGVYYWWKKHHHGG